MTDTDTNAAIDIATDAAMGDGTSRCGATRWHRDQAGEGVISTAIAVLIMALLGAAMWVAFNGMFSDAAESTREQIDSIGG